MLRSTAITKELAVIERKLSETTNETLKTALKKKQARLKDELKDASKSAPQLAKTLLAQRAQIKALPKSDFNDLIRRLSKKPEYSFLKTMGKSTIRTDLERPAKPVGWRFKGRGNYDKPTMTQIAKGKRNGTVYREVRPIRSDVNLAVRLEKGGVVGQEIVIDYQGDEYKGVIAQITDEGDYIVDIENGRTVLAEKNMDVISLGTMKKKSMPSERKKRFGLFEDGGNIEEENNEMLHSQAVEAKHHVEELHKVLTSKTVVEPWVVAKMERATTDLSDVTHYLDGENKADMKKPIYKNGGRLTDAQQAKFDKVMHEWKQGKLHSGSDNGPIVTDQDQAIAIAYAEARGMKKMAFGGMIDENNVSTGGILRMEELAPNETLDEFINNAKYIVSSLEDEGFEKDEIYTFLAHMMIRNTGVKMSEGGSFANKVMNRIKETNDDRKPGSQIIWVNDTSRNTIYSNPTYKYVKENIGEVVFRFDGTLARKDFRLEVFDKNSQKRYPENIIKTFTSTKKTKKDAVEDLKQKSENWLQSNEMANGGGVDAMSTVNEIARLSGLRAVAVAEWGDKNNINLSMILKDLKSKKIKGADLMTAIVGKPGNKYSKELIGKYAKMATGGSMSGWKHKGNC